MKNKLIIIFWLIAFSFFFFSFSSFAQEKNFNQSYQDYLNSLNQYNQAHQNYLLAKKSYLNYKTLTSKTDAFNKTLEMLVLRNEVISNYLSTIRLKLKEISGIINYKQNILYLNLENEINWYNTHKELLASTGSLEDLIAFSKQAETRYQEKTEILIYETLGNILISKEEKLKETINQTLRNLKAEIERIKEEKAKDTRLIERWLLEVDNRLILANEKKSEAEKILEQINKSRDKFRDYSQFQFILAQSHQYLKEANFYLKEIIREIKK
ncbi:MAG: hypothetical protein ACPLKP_00535 [Microgenomates group bacterium]